MKHRWSSPVAVEVPWDDFPAWRVTCACGCIRETSRVDRRRLVRYGMPGPDGEMVWTRKAPACALDTSKGEIKNG